MAKTSTSTSKKEATVAEREEQLEGARRNLDAATAALAAAEAAFDDEVTAETTEALTQARAHRALQLDLHARATRLLATAKAAAEEAARAELRARHRELVAEFDPTHVADVVAPLDLEEVHALEKVAEVRAKRRAVVTAYQRKVSEIERLREQLGEPEEPPMWVDPESGKSFIGRPAASVPGRITDPRPVGELLEERIRSGISAELAPHLRALAPDFKSYTVTR